MNVQNKKKLESPRLAFQAVPSPFHLILFMDTLLALNESSEHIKNQVIVTLQVSELTMYYGMVLVS